MATVKTAISLQTDVYKDGTIKAKSLFGGNFSAYIGYLISRDRELKQESQEKKDSSMLSAIEQILEL